MRDSEEEVLSRWEAALGSEPLGGVRELQLEVQSAVAHVPTARRLRVSQQLAGRLAEIEPDLGELVHQLAALRQALHGVLPHHLDAAAAAEAEHRVNTAIDRLVEACTKFTTDRLTAAAFVDSLTGLRNRHALERDLPERLALATRGARALSVVVADLDGLKTINDRDGHAAGDQALRALAASLNSALRAGDTAYRIGGDEFVIVLPDTNAEEAETVIGRVRRTAPSFGWGAATVPADGTDGARLIALADERLIGCRRNQRRPDGGDLPATSRRSTRQRPRRALAAAALAAAGMFGGGLAFAADGVLGSAQRDRVPTAESTTTATAGRSPEGATGSSGPNMTEAASLEDAALLDGADTAAGTRTTTTTAGIISALIEDTAGEIPAPIRLPDLGVRVELPVEPLQPAEVLGELVELDPASEADSPKLARHPRSAEKQHKN